MGLVMYPLMAFMRSLFHIVRGKSLLTLLLPGIKLSSASVLEPRPSVAGYSHPCWPEHLSPGASTSCVYQCAWASWVHVMYCDHLFSSMARLDWSRLWHGIRIGLISTIYPGIQL